MSMHENKADSYTFLRLVYDNQNIIYDFKPAFVWPWPTEFDLASKSYLIFTHLIKILEELYGHFQ